MQLIDPAHPFYRPLWRRAVIVAVTAAWFGFEALISVSQLWSVISGAVLAYTAWILLFTWKGEAGLKP